MACQYAGLVVVDMPTQAEPDLTAFAALPREHRPKIWFNSPIEHTGREIKRRAAVVQVFPDRGVRHPPDRRRPARSA